MSEVPSAGWREVYRSCEVPVAAARGRAWPGSTPGGGIGASVGTTDPGGETPEPSAATNDGRRTYTPSGER